MPGPLKNARRERFAQELAKGKTQERAYKAAKYRPNRGAAARLAAQPDIKARLAELQTKVAEKVVITAADIVAQLDDDRGFARRLKAPAAAVSATMGKAKVLGLITTQIGGIGGGPIEYRNLSDEEVEARIAAHEAARAAGADRSVS